jgi:thymidylate synthase
MIKTGQATQFPYKALHKPNQLIYGTGQTAVVTGWTNDTATTVGL